MTLLRNYDLIKIIEKKFEGKKIERTDFGTLTALALKFCNKVYIKVDDLRKIHFFIATGRKDRLFLVVSGFITEVENMLYIETINGYGIYLSKKRIVVLDFPNLNNKVYFYKLLKEEDVGRMLKLSKPLVLRKVNNVVRIIKSLVERTEGEVKKELKKILYILGI